MARRIVSCLIAGLCLAEASTRQSLQEELRARAGDGKEEARALDGATSGKWPWSQQANSKASQVMDGVSNQVAGGTAAGGAVAGGGTDLAHFEDDLHSADAKPGAQGAQDTSGTSVLYMTSEPPVCAVVEKKKTGWFKSMTSMFRAKEDDVQLAINAMVKDCQEHAATRKRVTGSQTAADAQKQKVAAMEADLKKAMDDLLDNEVAILRRKREELHRRETEADKLRHELEAKPASS